MKRQETPSQPLTKATGVPDKEKFGAMLRGEKGRGEKTVKSYHRKQSLFVSPLLEQHTVLSRDGEAQEGIGQSPN